MRSLSADNFAKKLKQLRNEHNLSVRVLGKLTGVGYTTVSRYENIKREPELITAYKLAKYFGVTLEYMCEGDDPSSPITIEKEHQD